MIKHLLPVLAFVLAVLCAGYVGYRVGVSVGTAEAHVVAVKCLEGPRMLVRPATAGPIDPTCYVTRIPGGAHVVANSLECVEALTKWHAEMDDE